MISIDEYVMPASVPEAFALLRARTDAAIIGGGVFTRLMSKKIGLAIDLSKAGLDYIHETDQAFEIGAMTSLRTLETDTRLNHFYDGVLASAVGHIVGVQLRNLATVGGTVYGRYAFSDLITTLLALDGTVILHHTGAIPLADFLTQQRADRDILEKVVLPKSIVRASAQSFRNTSGSLPILTVAAAKTASGFRIAVGARPGQAILALGAMAELAEMTDVTGMADNTEMQHLDSIVAQRLEAAAVRAANRAISEIEFGDDRRASGNYRRLLCQTLVKRVLMEVLG